jgi:outer membrane protein
MFYLAKIFFYIVLIFNFSIVQSAEKIVYLDIDQVLNQTIIGKEIIKNLDTLRKKNLNDIQKKQTDLKEKRDKIQKQKNILSEEEFKVQAISLENEFRQFNKYNKKVSTEFDKKKQTELDEFIKFIQPIIEDYIKEKSITIVLNKKNIFIASKDYDITDEIINIVDKNGQ